jgi:transcriptional regulator with XRE-family HTH domain
MLKINNRISVNVKYFRKLKGLTQEKLAEKVEVSTVYINYLERGSKVPSLVLLDKIADALEIDPTLLFIQDDDPTNLEIKKLVGTVSGLEKKTIQFINEMIIAFLNFKSSSNDS